MSEMRVNTLKDASGGNTMPISDINQGRAKAWFNLNGTGTIAPRDTFNISSFVDNGVSDYTSNFSVAASNSNYSITSIGSNPGVDTSVALAPVTSAANQSTTFLRQSFQNNAATSFVDCSFINTQFIGDPA